ncbi:alpha/beta fold hydrolase [Desertivirga arenae]|uniref:alpha/beta fold hydrolase n=1 Tax=Desertivirga arenae TaxID=2810309 RepID=UPI001A95EFF3|nr:alpha/beta hydrolase [Pedobacter sp. SYSU D00823]
MVDIIKRNNVRIHGDGNKCMVMAHGFGCDQNVWRHLIKAFETEYKVVVFDYVGAGQSDLDAYDPKKYSSLDGYAEDVHEVIQTLALKDVIFIGHSVSCMIGLRAAIKYPQHFQHIIMVAPSPSYINTDDYIGGMNREDIEALFEVMDANYLGWSASMAPLIMGNPDAPELGEELAANFCATDPEIARQFARVTFFSDNRSDLQNLPVKSLTLQCSDDILAPLEVGFYIEKHTPQNTLAILNATGHCPHLSAPEETIAVIKSYLNTN